MARGLLFAATGIAWFALWFFTDPAHQTTASMQQWPNVIAFSSCLLLLGVSMVAFGRMVGGQLVTRVATVAGGLGVWLSIANVIEDGFRVEAAFLAFVLGLLALDGTLGVLAVTILRTVAGRRRLLAAIPGAVLAAILLMPVAGGPLMLGAWLAAAAAALMAERLSEAPAREAPYVS